TLYRFGTAGGTASTQSPGGVSAGGDPGDEGGEEVAELGVADGVGVAVEGGRLAVHDHEAGTVGEGDLGERRSRVDAERRAEGEEHVAVRGRLLGPGQVLAHEVLAEADRGRVHHPA